MIFECIATFLAKINCFYAYVDNNKSFLHPLNKEDEDRLVDLMEKGDESARQKLIEHNMRLVAHIVKKYSSTYEADDLISVGCIGLIKAINSFKAEKGANLSTYASRCIENEILMLMRANKKHQGVESLDEPIGMERDGSDIAMLEVIPEDDTEKLFNTAHNTILMEEINQIMQKYLSKREYFVICTRYGLNNTPAYTQREVAKMLKISRSYISRIEKKALEILKEKIKEHKIYEE